MTDNLLLKLARGESDLKSFENWLLLGDQEDQLNISYKCTRADFLTYFLNFIHEEVPRLPDSQGKIPSSKSSLDLSIEPALNDVSETRKCLEGDSNTHSPSKPNLHRIDQGNGCRSAINYPLINSPEKNLHIEEKYKGFNPTISPMREKRLNINNHSPTQRRINIAEIKDCSLKSSNLHNSSLEIEDCSLNSISFRSNNNMSTPKVSRNHSQSRLNTSHFSPISPLYHHNQTRPVLCLGDFLTKSNKKETPENRCKRIKPTCLNKQKFNSSFKKTNSFSNFNVSEVSTENSDSCRSILIEERLKVAPTKESDKNLMAVVKKINSLKRVELEANASLVSNRKELWNIAYLYKIILTNHLVLNINSEIYFLLSLLTTTRYENDDSCDVYPLDELKDLSPALITSCSYFFSTLHNIVYFAIMCLESQRNVLKYYDRATLNFLSQNQRIKHFSESFSSDLKTLSEEKPERIYEVALNTNECPNVFFNTDTDNRDNFPNDISFHSFRKQRDLFYEVLRIWECSYGLPNWNFFISLGGKIRTLINLQADSANLIYFSRLFKTQLLNNCEKPIKKEDVSRQPFSLLTSLPNINTDKLNRLKSRLVTKQSVGSSNCLPLFPEYQEFYRDFIVVASNHIFNRHLCDIFVKEIIELNNMRSSGEEYEESEETGNADPRTRKEFTSRLRYLRILAKFLGFVVSLPYKSEHSNYSELVLNTRIKSRQQVMPPLDLRGIIQDSIEWGIIVLTIPWVTNYLAMLDFVTLRLPYYTSIHKTLFHLYKTYRMECCDYNCALVTFSLGWLFELPHFPESNFYKFSLELDASSSKSKYLDSLNVVDQSILYSCCPYMEEVKKLLTSTAVSETVTIKHITPITEIHSSEEIARKRTEQQLEEAFLNSQPVSYRKTIEFVSERIASTCVKHICNKIVPEYRKKVIKEVVQYLEENSEHKLDHAVMRSKLHQKIPAYFSSLTELCKQEATNIMKDKISIAIDSLLAVDTLPQTKSLCISVTVKSCKERVKQWMVMHVSASVFGKDIDSEVQKFLSRDGDKSAKPVFVISSHGNREEHREDSLSAAHLLEKIKNLSVMILDKSQEVNEAAVVEILKESEVTLSQRWDVNENINSYISMLLVDVSLLLIIHVSNVMTVEEVKRRFKTVWRLYYGSKDNLFKNLMCPRNVMLLAQADDGTSVWDRFAKFVAFLIKESVVSSDCFECQCTAFYRKDWDEGTLKNISYFFKKFVVYYNAVGGETAKFTHLLEFFSEYCTDL